MSEEFLDEFTDAWIDVILSQSTDEIMEMTFKSHFWSMETPEGKD